MLLISVFKKTTSSTKKTSPKHSKISDPELKEIAFPTKCISHQDYNRNSKSAVLSVTVEEICSVNPGRWKMRRVKGKEWHNLLFLDLESSYFPFWLSLL